MAQLTARERLLQGLPALGPYATAALLVLCTLVVRLSLAPLLGERAPYIFFFLAIVLIRQLWGRGPALLATLLGGIVSWYFIVLPQFSFAYENPADALNLAAYFAAGMGISFIGGLPRRPPSPAAAKERPVRFRIFRQIAIIAAAVVVLAEMTILLTRDLHRSHQADAWVVHSYKVINSARSLMSLVENAVIGERGYLLTGDQVFLAPYATAVRAIPLGLKELRYLTADNSAQQTRCNELNHQIDQRLAMLKLAIKVRRAGDVNATVALVRSGEGDRSMSAIRATLDAVLNEEDQLLVARRSQAEEQAVRGRWVLGLGSGALILLLVFASVVIERDNVQREEITNALRHHAGLIEQAHDSLLTYRVGGGINYWSRGAEELYGYTREEALGRSSHELLNTAHPLGLTQIDATLDREGCWNGELTQSTKDRRKLVVEAQWRMAVDARGNKMVLEANLDITERKQAQERLRESEEQFRTLANAIPQLCWMANEDGWIFWYNQRWYQYTGTSPQQMEGWGWQSVHDPEALPNVLERWKQSIATGELFDMTFPLRGADGVFRPFLTRVMPVKDDSGKVVRWFGTNTDVSEQRKAEEELRQSEARLRTLGDNLPDGAIYRFRMDSAGQPHIDFISAGIERLTGIPAAEFMSDSESVNQSVVPEDRKPLHIAIARSREHLTRFEVEVRHRHRVTGEIRWSLLRSTPTRLPDGSTIWDGIELDVSERKKAEAERLLLATAIEQAAETVVVTDRNGKIQFVNPAFSRTSGYTRAEAYGQNPRILKSGSHDAKFYADLWATLGAGKIWHGEFTNRRKDGTLYIEDATVTPVRGASGEITNYIAIKSDITERKQKEIALRESEAMLRFFVQHAPAAIAMLDREMRYLVVSDRWMTDYHLDNRDLRGLCHYDVFPEIPERWKKIHQRCMQGGVERCEEDPFPRANGSTDWVRWELRPWRKFDDSVGGIIIFSEVITERKLAEEARAESELRYRQLFERSESAMAVYEMLYDEQGNPCDFRYLRSNPAFQRVTGRVPSQILGRTALEVTPEIEEYWIKFFGQVAKTGEAAVFEHYAKHLGRYYSGVAYSPRPNQVAVSFTDATERRLAEEKVRLLNAELEQRVLSRTAELEAANRELEAFAYSVSHDLRAPLRGIDGWSLALLEDYGHCFDEQGQKYMGRVRSEAQRMGVLIDDLLHLSRVSRTELAPILVDLSSLASTIANRLKEAHRDRSIEFIIARQLNCVGDERLFEIALTNLLDNAVKFTAQRTPAKVEFGQMDIEGQRAFFVRDNGVGFDMTYAKLLFTPFQRLHKASEFPGTGIGLATVQRAIRRHGGRIWAESRVGEGTSFYFTVGDGKP